MPESHDTKFRHLILATFFGLVACGMSFYVFLFAALMVLSLTHQANPAATPGLQAGLRHIALPIGVVFGLTVSIFTFVRLRKRSEAGIPSRDTKNNKAAV